MTRMILAAALALGATAAFAGDARDGDPTRTDGDRLVRSYVIDLMHQPTICPAAETAPILAEWCRFHPEEVVVILPPDTLPDTIDIIPTPRPDNRLVDAPAQEVVQ